MLNALMNGAQIKPDFQPQNNKQAYLAYLCGLDIPRPEPRMAEEILLCKMCVDGVGGGSLKTNDAAYLFYKKADSSKKTSCLKPHRARVICLKGNLHR